MSDEHKYSDQRGKSHDSMLGAQWANEEYEKKSNKPSDPDGDGVKIIVFLGFVYLCTAFVAILKIVRVVAPEFSHGTPGGITILVLFLVSVVAFFVGMAKLKSSDAVLFYSIAAVGLTSTLCYLLPAP